MGSRLLSPVNRPGKLTKHPIAHGHKMHKLNLFARLFCGVAVAAGAPIAGQPASTVAVAWDRPLVEQLPTGSRDVIVKRLADPGPPVLPSGPLSFAEAIEVARDFSAAVVVVELTQVEAYLAEGATWIHTKMTPASRVCPLHDTTFPSASRIRSL